MKKVFILVLLLSCLFCLNACKNKNESNSLVFTQSEYKLKSGEAVALVDAPKDVTYQIVSSDYPNVSINAQTGVVTFDTTIPHSAQIIVIATLKGKVSDPCVVTLYYDYEQSDVKFTNMSEYVSNNEYINAVSSKNYSVIYSLKNEVKGITINKDTGKVSYSPIVTDGTVYTVVADSHGSKNEMTFIAMTEGFVKAVVNKQALSKTEQTIPAVYPLDFSDSELVGEEGIVGVLNGKNEPLDSKYYVYNASKQQVEISPNYVDELSYGVSTLKIVTKRNTLYVDLVVVTKFIYTPEDLASIDDSIEALSGYYILMKDIDLSEYLSPEGAGYNDGKGWTPIGSYVDTLDTNVATQYSFKGTFDGNGHVIKGLYSNRKDTYAFNAGLFGYITNSATIKNLGVEGELHVSSYSGGLVGSNSGLIENCWANVAMDVYSGEDSYRYVGGFVGNNFGTISNCYAIGEVVCDREFGGFAGSNQGIITNCYTVESKDCNVIVGAGYQAENYQIFTNLDEMKAFDWSSVFPGKDWKFVGNTLPDLTETITDFNVRTISLEADSNRVYTDDKFQIHCLIYPRNLYSEYSSKVEYEVIGEGAYLIGDTIYTDKNLKDLTVKASLTINGVTYTDSFTFEVVKKIEELIFESDIDTVEVGKSYLLEASYTPMNAGEKISFKLLDHYCGVTIEDNILTIDPEYFMDKQIILCAMTETGLRSKTITLDVVYHTPFNPNAQIIYENEDKNIEFKFNSVEDLTNMKITFLGKEVNYSVNNNVVTISKDLITATPNVKCNFTFTLTDGRVYIADAYYITHKNYKNEANINEEVIYINSVDDFFKYFNADPNTIWDEAKLANYDKTFVLTTDLDFSGKTLYGIGTSEAPFEGKIYGLGHTIKNFNIFQNERICLDEEESSYYCVGLFANVSTAEFYDITIENATVDGKNFAGSLVGMMTDGVVENCVAINSVVTASEYIYSADGIFVGKVVGKNYNAKIIAVYQNGLSINTIG